MPLQKVIIGWRGLERIINQIIETVNSHEPIEGAGIRITEHKEVGKVIELAALADGKTPTSPTSPTSPGGGGTQQPHLLADSITWYGVKWQGVTVVDPKTCAQSTLSVLVYTGDDNDSIYIAPVKYPFWVEPV